VASYWSDATTGEVGSMVREAIKRGSGVEKEAQAEWCSSLFFTFGKFFLCPGIQFMRLLFAYSEAIDDQ
jgi:hypothetical protein